MRPSLRENPLRHPALDDALRTCEIFHFVQDGGGPLQKKQLFLIREVFPYDILQLLKRLLRKAD